MAQNGKIILGRYRFLVLAMLLLAIVIGAFLILKNQPSANSQQSQIPINTPVNPAENGALPTMEADQQDMTIKLSQGKAQAQTEVPMPVATGQPLTDGQIDGILARLPGLTAESGDQQDFNLAQQPIPPPRTGETIQQPFPPPATAAQPVPVEAGPLKVLRFSPEGEIPIAPFVSITFNQPMVPLATIGDLAAGQVPAQIEPSLPGVWRWLGTRTLTFQYDSSLIDRLPKATEYHITIPAGTKSASGNSLAETTEWSFTTPPPKVIFTYPSDQSQPRDPLFFVTFDQRVDPAAVLNTVQVTAAGLPVSLKLVGEAEIQADKEQSWLLKNILEGRWVAFRATEPLPADADVNIAIGPKTPSAEGPLVTTEAQLYHFRTYAPLRIAEHGCSWGGPQCPPLSPFFIRFNNSLDTKIAVETLLKIDPELPGAAINAIGNTITIQGASKGRTTYTVTVDGSIQDIYGQKLGQNTRLTFKVGQAEPALMGPNQNFVTLDPAAKKPVFSVYAINYARLDVRINAVQPSDWPAYQQYLRDYQRTDIQVKLPGRQVLSKTINVESAADTLSEVNIDLTQVMDGPYGHFIVMVQPPSDLLKDPQNRYWQTVQAWVQVTQIGLDAFTDHSDMVLWASALKDGAPLAGISVSAGPSGRIYTTGPDGTTRFAIPDGTGYLVATQGADRALLPRSNYFYGDDGWSHRPVNDELRWYVFDDRQIYRPGEDVHIKGWLRRIGGTQSGDVGLVGSDLEAVHYQITGPQGNELGSGRAEVSALGGFDISYTLPQSVNLGYAQLTFTTEGNLSGLDGLTYGHGFQIQEFRRPEFEVTARNETIGPYFAGDRAVLAVEAKYYAGGGLPNADVNWQVSSTPAPYAPPNWPDFTFGEWTPWWSKAAYDFGPYNEWSSRGQPAKIETFTGKTDASGTHYLQLDFDQAGGPRPVSVVADATVMDVNRQAWTGTTTLMVHPANLYIGLHSERVFVERGTPLKVETIVTDLDGKPVADRPVEVTAARLEWKYRDGQWREEAVDVQKCTQGSAEKPVTCVFQTPLGGSYQITAVVTDDHGRKNQSRFTRWVSGGKIPPARQVEQEKVTLIPDKETYQPGDIAQVLVQSPFSPAEGLLTVNRSGILFTERFQIVDGTATLKIPIQESYIPNVQIQVDVNGSTPRTDDQGNAVAGIPPRPAFATGQLNLEIPPVQRTLSLQVTPEQKELEPGGETNLNLVLKDAGGQPVPDAELAVVVVDEAILALTNYQLSDPIAAFYSDRPLDLMSVYGRSSIVLANPQALARDQAAGAMPMATQAAGSPGGRNLVNDMMAPAAPSPQAEKAATGAPEPAIRVRTNFNPLAVFAPAVRTDANGAAQVMVKLPDNLTRYRVMVVAVAQGHQFGTGETNLVARLALMARPSAPRFLNFGDRFELPVVLQNQTDQSMQVDVVLRTANIELTGSRGQRVMVPARDRIEVRFPAAAQKAGIARFQVVAVSGSFSDAASIELPVYTPATTEAFATYGVIDAGAVAQPVAALQGVFPQYGGLEISTSSTALQALTDAVLYLVQYPYDCTEQISSRVLAVAALRDVLSAFKAEGLPSQAELEAAVQKDIQTLQGLQNDDGGFPYWRRGQETIPFNTIHTAHALYRAESKGFSVPAEMKQRVLEYLRQIENHYPAWYSLNTRQTLSAYALYVRNLMGDRDPNKAQRLIDEAGLEKLSLNAVGWLWPVLQDSGATAQLDNIRRLINNRVVETAGAANFTTDYDEQNYLLLGSDRRTDAILLDALIGDNPQSDLIPKLVNGLLAQRTRGRWMNTQENVFVLLALDHYFNTFEAQTPDFVVKVWLGDNYAGSQEFVGRTTDRYETKVPMTYLVDPTNGGGGTQNLVLSKEGDGRLYYRLGLRYAPTDLHLDPMDMGFVVQREYEAVNSPDDVRRDPDGTWQIKAGAKVRVHLTLVADNRRYHVALADPLPAGLEIVNPDLAVSGSVPQDRNSVDYRYGWWRWTWYEHQNLRDERAEAFTSLLWEGVYQYSYTARATTPGTFIVPPAKAEEMYSPEVFGRSSSDVVVVK